MGWSNLNAIRLKRVYQTVLVPPFHLIAISQSMWFGNHRCLRCQLSWIYLTWIVLTPCSWYLLCGRFYRGIKFWLTINRGGNMRPECFCLMICSAAACFCISPFPSDLVHMVVWPRGIYTTWTTQKKRVLSDSSRCCRHVTYFAEVYWNWSIGLL